MARQATTTSASAMQLVRLSVQWGERRADVGLPGGVPLVELLPALTRRLNVLDPLQAPGGYRLVRPDGHVLDGERSLVAQGLDDGDVLSLESGADDAPPKVYDDLVEAVADVVEKRAKPWSSQDTATTATAASAILLSIALAPALLAYTAAPTLVVPAAAALSAIVMFACAMVLDRRSAPVQAPVALVQVAALHAAAAGFTALGELPGWGLPVAFAGAAAALVGAAGMLTATRSREYGLIPLSAGLLFAVVGVLIGMLGVPVHAALALAMALAGIAGLGVPWLALAALPLRVASARDDSEVYAAPEHISPADVAAHFARGHRYQVSLRIAICIVVLIATIPVVASGPFGLALTAATYIGMLLGTRHVFSRADILAVASATLGGIVLTVITAVTVHPGWGTWMIAALAIIAAVVIVVTLLEPRHRLGLARAADPAEWLTIALLLPLALVVGEWF